MSPPNTTSTVASTASAVNKSLFTEKFCYDYPMIKGLDPSKGTNKSPSPTFYTLPNLFGDCPYVPIRSPYEHDVSRASEKWFLDNVVYDTEKTTKLMGLKAGQLTSACYPIADEFHLRAVADYLNWLFNMDDWMDDYSEHQTITLKEDCMNAMENPTSYEAKAKGGEMTKDYTVRLAKTAGPSCLRRFIDNMGLFFDAVVVQSADREADKTPTLEEYIDVRRDTSGCKPCFQLAEYVGRFDLPQEVVDNKRIMRMEQSTNDLVTWSNDIFSYNKEQIRSDTHSMIPVLMHHYGLELQEAVNFVGSMCKQAIDNFAYDRELLWKETEGKWSEGLKRMVEEYALGLEHWISGSLHWSFETERYFGKIGARIKKDKIVTLSPKLPTATENTDNSGDECKENLPN